MVSPCLGRRVEARMPSVMTGREGGRMERASKHIVLCLE